MSHTGKLRVQGPGRIGRGESADGVTERLDRIEAALADLTPEPVPIGEQFIVGQIEQARLTIEALLEAKAALEQQLAELRQGKGA